MPIHIYIYIFNYVHRYLCRYACMCVYIYIVLFFSVRHGMTMKLTCIFKLFFLNLEFVCKLTCGHHQCQPHLFQPKHT